MQTQMRLRFWLEAVLATITSALLLLTLVWDDWAESLFDVSPDGGNGSFERWIVGTLLIATIVLFNLARYEWRRTRSFLSNA